MNIINLRTLIVLIITVCTITVLTGCTSTRFVKPYLIEYHKDSLSYFEFHRLYEDRSIKVILNDDQKINGSLIKINSDSIRFIIQPENIYCVLPLRKILRIEVIEHTSGAIFGFFAGLCGGGVLGWVFGSLQATGDMREMGVALSTLGGGFAGALSGLVFGAIKGNRIIFEFKKE
jgi:hypothetical protein